MIRGKMNPPERSGRRNERVALVCIMRACRQLDRVCRRVKLVRATSQPTPTCVALRRVASISLCIIFGASPRCRSISIVVMFLKSLCRRQELSSANTHLSPTSDGTEAVHFCNSLAFGESLDSRVACASIRDLLENR